METLPGWKINIDEVSNSVYKVTLTDANGRKAEATDAHYKAVIQHVTEYVFDIEKQVSVDWNRFLYELCLVKYKDLKTVRHEYNDQYFGSWFVEFAEKRIVYDGRDACLIRQVKKEDWQDEIVVNKAELTYSIFENIVS